jgi:alpha-glucoside transport system substrate-binding protein
MSRPSVLNRFAVGLAAAALLVTACGGGGGGQATGGGGGGGSPAAGSTIRVTSLWGGAEQENFQKVLDAFKAKTGITAQFESIRTNYADVLRQRIAGGNPHDVAIMPGIGFLRSFARDGNITKLSDLGINKADIEGNYAPGILDISTVDNELYGVMVKFNSKSTVWYRPDKFKELGVQPAATWDDFKKLVSDIKAKGTTPLGLGAGTDSEWTLTDWFESIYLRQAGTEKYDQLFSGQLAWTDPSVKAAIEEMKAVITNDNVVGGINAALGTGFVDAIGQVYSANPKAAMYVLGGFVGGIATGQVNKNLKIGEEIDWFEFPTFGSGKPVTIGGDIIAPLTKNPGVKEFIQYMTTPEAGEVWAKTGAIISPVKAVPAEAYPNDLAKKEAQQVANAEAVRFDGSDLLPAGSPNLGALMQSALRGENLDPLLQNFETQVKAKWQAEGS